MDSGIRPLIVAFSLTVSAACGSAVAPASPTSAQPASTAIPTPTPQPTRSLATNDVSVLFPLGGQLWTSSMAARNGDSLFPRSAFDLIRQPVIRELQGGDATYAGLRVVSLRVDPCFGGSPCYPQIRLVFQGLSADGTRAFDGAIHALYNLTAEEFATLTSRLKAVAVLAPENAPVTRLEVGPALLAQGMNGAYGLALREVVGQYIGASNLAKVTFMTRSPGGGDRWDFGGFNTRDFQPSGAFPLAGLDGSVFLQTVRENGQRGGGGPGAVGAYAYTVTPGILRGELNLVLSSATAQNSTATDRQRAMDALARVENPSLESPDTVDCSACHVANRIRGNLQAVYGLSSALSYTSAAEPTRLIGGAERDNENLRAFGYFDVQPAISQRTANETLKVLAAMK